MYERQKKLATDFAVKARSAYLKDESFSPEEKSEQIHQHAMSAKKLLDSFLETPEHERSEHLKGAIAYWKKYLIFFD